MDIPCTITAAIVSFCVEKMGEPRRKSGILRESVVSLYFSGMYLRRLALVLDKQWSCTMYLRFWVRINTDGIFSKPALSTCLCHSPVGRVLSLPGFLSYQSFRQTSVPLVISGIRETSFPLQLYRNSSTDGWRSEQTAL